MRSYLSTRVFKNSWWHQGVVFTLLMVIYVLSMPKTVVLEDDGSFILSSYYLGVSHPPGYPIHTFLGHLFSYIPMGSVAFRIHLLSAVFGALTCVVLWYIVDRFVPQRFIVTIVTLSYGVTELFWSQSIISEVYTLNTFFFFLLLLLCLKYHQIPNLRLFQLIAFTYGLSLCNHWPLMVLSTACLLVILQPHYYKIAKSLGKWLPFVFLGLLPYAWMVIRSQMDSEITFNGPIGTWDEFWSYVSRKTYSGVDSSESAGWKDRWGYIEYLGKTFLNQYTIVGAIFILWGSYFHLKRSWRVFLAFLVGILGSSLLLVMLLDFDFEYLMIAVFRVYILVPIGIVAIWLGMGLSNFGHFAHKRIGPWAGPLMAFFGILFIVTLVAANWERNNRDGDVWANEYAHFILGELDRDAILFVFSDTDSGPIPYANKVEGIRPDVDIYQTQGLLLSNRLFHPVRDPLNQKETIKEFALQSERPVYFTNYFPNGVRPGKFGFFQKVLKEGDVNTPKLTFTENSLQYFSDIVALGPLKDRWNENHRQNLIFQYSGFLAIGGYLSKDKDRYEAYRPYLEMAETTYLGSLAIAENLLNYGNDQHLTIARSLLDDAHGLIDSTVSKRNYARFYHLKGYLSSRMNDLEAAMQNFERSIAIHPQRKNPSVNLLLQLYVFKKSKWRYWEVRNRFYKSNRVPEMIAQMDKKMTKG